MSGEFVVLTECANSVELTGIRTVLEAQGIACITEGENQSYFPGLGSAILVEKRVLVRPEDLERARALLGSESVHETPGAPLEGAVCPVHQEQALSTCDRCGSFLCASCKSPGDRPICESCLELERKPPAPEPAPAQPKWFFVILAIVIALILTRSLWLN